MNFAHRARVGMQIGSHPIMFHFFRNLRALVGTHSPDNVVLALEGHPKHRHKLMPEYKANRQIDDDDPEREAKIETSNHFFDSITDCLNLIRVAFPITIIKHPFYEADDTIHNFAAELISSDGQNNVTISSSDTDFIQSVCPNIALYNPTQKKFIDAPDYDYVSWKALKGDGSDGIPGIPRVGAKTAEKLVRNGLKEYLENNNEAASLYSRNVELIRFKTFDENDWNEFMIHTGKPDWDVVKASFNDHGFDSITNDTSWKRFVSTFDRT